MSDAPPQADDLFAHGLPTVESGAGLRLRAFRDDDAAAVYLLYRDKDATRFGYSPKMDDLDDALRVVAECRRLAAERTLFHFGVALEETDEIIGHATLFKLERAHGRAEVGYSIRRDLWGRGKGTLAVSVLLELAFDRLGLRRIEADVDPRNIASLRLLEKLGFEQEGLLRERWELAGELQDAVLLGLLRRSWRGRPADLTPKLPGRGKIGG